MALAPSKLAPPQEPQESVLQLPWELPPELPQVAPENWIAAPNLCRL